MLCLYRIITSRSNAVDSAYARMQRVRFHGVNARAQVFGRNLDLGYVGSSPGVPTTGNIIASRHDNGGFSIIAQASSSSDFAHDKTCAMFAHHDQLLQTS